MEVFGGLRDIMVTAQGASVTQDDTPDPLKAFSQFPQPTCYRNLMSDTVNPFSVLHTFLSPHLILYTFYFYPFSAMTDSVHEQIEC